VAAALVLVGCNNTAASNPQPTVTVTVTPSAAFNPYNPGGEPTCPPIGQDVNCWAPAPTATVVVHVPACDPGSDPLCTEP
jgi:hypothetical protein